MTQAELAEALGVTNKAVSKWETGEAMPETGQLVPISEIFGVTVDELLKGRREERGEREVVFDEIKNHIFTRGKEDEANKTLAEKICGTVCAAVFFAGLATYLMLGALAGLWNPHWVIVPCSALACGIIGVIGDTLNPVKRERRRSRGENPYTGCICGVIMLSCTIVYILVSTFTGLWHPLWVIEFGGGIACFIVSAIGDIVTHNKK